MRQIVIAAALILAPALVSGQSTMSDQTLRPLVVEAIKTGAGNPDKVVDALDRLVRTQFGEFDKSPLMLVSFAQFSSLGAIADAPYVSFRAEFRDRLRKFEPIDDLHIEVDVVTIRILPQQMSAADIVKVVVQRDNGTIEPINDRLATREFSNRLGGKVILHAGDVTFPYSAFAPGATVRITLVPASGKNITTTLDEKQLRRFK